MVLLLQTEVIDKPRCVTDRARRIKARLFLKIDLEMLFLIPVFVMSFDREIRV